MSTTPNPSRRPSLSFRPAADGRSIILRADNIRALDLLRTAATWNEDGGPAVITDSLGDLAAVMDGDPHPAALHARIEAVEEAARLDDPEMPMGLTDAIRLYEELGAAIAAMATAPRMPKPRRGAA